MKKLLPFLLILILLSGCGTSPSDGSADSFPTIGGAMDTDRRGDYWSPASEAPQISAASAILIEASTGQILYEKNPREKSWPASITKIMTALLGIESGDVKRIVPVADEAVGTEGSSIYLKGGERISMEDLLYGMMLRSGNDAAMAVASASADSIEDFVGEMNRRAEEIGALDTHFMNPSGLHDQNHYTTAYDMAMIAREAMKNPIFREIAAAESWTADREGEEPYNLFQNKNKVVFQYEGGNGIKLGYTQTAGRTLVASSSRNGMEVICVVLNDSNWFEDAYALMDYAYENWEMIKVMEGGGPLLALPLKFGERKQVQLGLGESVFIPVPKGTIPEIQLQYEMDPVASAPVSRWEEAGRLKVLSEEREILSVPIYFLEDIPRYIKDN